MTISVEDKTMSKMIGLIKQKTTFADFTIQSGSAKDFLYGTLYKFTLITINGKYDEFIYHDHSTEEIIPLFTK